MKKIIFYLFLIFMAPVILYSQKPGEDIIIGKYDTFYSKILNEERILMINLPEAYDLSDQQYPVLYLLDGEINILAEAASMLHHYGKTDIVPMIIVAVINTNRNRDMMPFEGANKFMRLLSEELIPYIEKNYRANKYRILYGVSNAALFVTYSFIEQPEVFSAYIASSPMIGWCAELMEKKTKELFSGPKKLSQFFYIIHGGSDYPQVKEYLPGYLKILSALEKKGLKFKVKFIPECGHVPYGSLYYGLFNIFEGYTYPENKKNTEGLETLKQYYEKISKRLNYEIKYPVKTLLTIGQRLLKENKIDEAVSLYELNARHNPEVWDSNFILAYLYLKTGKTENARKYYLQALKINPDYPSPEFQEMKKVFK